MPALHRFRSLTEELTEIQRQMEQHARNYGLDFFPTIFEVVAEQKRYLDFERAYTETLRAAYEARTALNRALGEAR